MKSEGYIKQQQQKKYGQRMVWHILHFIVYTLLWLSLAKSILNTLSF